MPSGVILVDYTDQGRRAIKESPDRAEASKAEAKKLGITVKDLYYTPGGPMTPPSSLRQKVPSQFINSWLVAVNK